MRLIVHDLTQEQVKKIISITERDVVIGKEFGISPCIGCFGCWVKDPGACILKDAYNHMGEWIAKCEEFIIISENYYGGYSPFVKNILDRSISYLHPFFLIQNNEMHHRKRYKNAYVMRSFFYGDVITEAEKQTTKNLIEANQRNLHSIKSEIYFAKSPEEFGGDLL